MPRILIETEGGGTIGLGHVYRSIALARALARAGAEVGINVLGEAARTLVSDAGFRLARGVYGYLADAIVEDRRPGGPRAGTVLPLVELVDEYSDASGRAPFALASFEGPPYHPIIRPEFSEPPSSAAVPGGVMVCLGGVDPTGSTRRIVEGLRAHDLDVLGIVGPGSTDRQDFYPTTAIWRAMALAQVVVTSGGMTALEAAAMGKTVYAVSHNEREDKRMRKLAKRARWLFYCGPAAEVDVCLIGDCIKAQLAAPHELAQLSAEASVDVDGRGADRAAAFILERLEHAAHAPAAAQ